MFNKEKYREIIESTLFPFVENVHGGKRNIILQEDNCGPHRAKSIKEFFAEHRVFRMNWPSQSPDLNPIENAWGYMKNKLRRMKTRPSNKEHLFEIISDMWDTLPFTYFEKLTGSMPNRVAAVLGNDRGATKY